MKTIDRQKLRQILAEINHAMPVCFTCLTDARARVTGNPHGIIRKLAKHQAFTGAIYERSVQRRQVAEGGIPLFEAQPRKWGQRISSCLVRHETTAGEVKWYLPVHITRPGRPLYLIERLENHLSKRRRKLVAVAKDKIAHLLPASRPAGEAQGVEKGVEYRDVSLESITSISLGGEVYRVED